MAKQRKNADRHKRKTVSFRLPASLMDEFRKVAKENRRTLSGEAQVAFEKHLQANGKKVPSDLKGSSNDEDS